MPAPHADSDASFHPPPPAESTSNKWGPYSGSGDFGASMAIVLAGLFATVLLAFSLGAAIHLFLRRRRDRNGPCNEPRKPAPAPAGEVPTMVFSAAGTKLAGAEAECSICLTEFAEGDAVRVLPACSHGFHVRCIQRWLAAKSSCPTCRACCDVDVGSKEQSQAQGDVEAVSQLVY